MNKRRSVRQQQQETEPNQEAPPAYVPVRIETAPHWYPAWAVESAVRRRLKQGADDAG